MSDSDRVRGRERERVKFLLSKHSRVARMCVRVIPRSIFSQCFQDLLCVT